jgi:hypothetical protein
LSIESGLAIGSVRSGLVHTPVTKDLLFSNWLLMYLAGNYGGSDNSSAFPGGCFCSGLKGICRKFLS